MDGMTLLDINTLEAGASKLENSFEYGIRAFQDNGNILVKVNANFDPVRATKVSCTVKGIYTTWLPKKADESK